jgi:hypothetical protein
LIRRIRAALFDRLATINAISAGQTIDLGAIGILGCWPPVPSSQIDLVSDSITAPATATKGSQIAVTSSFRNQGTVTSGPFEAAACYFSIDAAIDTSDKFTGFTCSVPGLPAGGTGTCNGLVNVPNVVPGNYYVGLLVDRTNQVGENLETNNSIAAGNLTAVQANPLNPIVNGSFETGDLTGWTVKELTPASNPNLPLSVHWRGCGISGAAILRLHVGKSAVISTTSPAHPPMDNTPCCTILMETIRRRTVRMRSSTAANCIRTSRCPPERRHSSSTIGPLGKLFRFGSTQNRTFDLEIEPLGGGATLLDQTILFAWNGGFEEDTDHPSGETGSYPPGIVDLSAFAGQSVRLKFVWNIPEPGTGFGFFQLDNIRLNTTPHRKLGSHGHGRKHHGHTQSRPGTHRQLHLRRRGWGRARYLDIPLAA